MLSNYFKTAWRQVLRDRFYTPLNIFGLALGLACFFLIVLFIRDELSFDRFHKKHERIHRIVGILELEGQGEQSSSQPFPLAQAVMTDYPHLVENVVRFFNFQDPQHTLKVGDIKINETQIFVADSDVFRVFDFPLIKGDPLKVLAEPNTMVMTQEMAQKYFGDEDPVGKVVKFDGVRDITITGILGKIPAQSHIHFEALISFSTMRTMMPGQFKNWVWNPNWTYVLLKEGVDSSALNREFPAFVQKYYPDFLKPQVTHFLQPLTDIHLHSSYSYEIEQNSDASLIYIFLIVGIFILVIACINFTNLATARAANRAKETGVRKTAGAARGQLIMQFMTESFLFSGIAVVLSVILAVAMLPVFNSISGKSIVSAQFADPLIILIALATWLVTAAGSGMYPAFYLSSLDPVRVLKGRMMAGRADLILRKILVVVQFTISVSLIIGTGTVYLQLKYLQSAQLGFNKSSLLMLPVRPPMGKIFESLIENLKADPDVEKVTRMNDVVGKHHNIHEYNFKGMQPGKWIYYPSLQVDEEFLPAMQMELVAGRNFSKAFPRDDSLAVIVNESMVKHMGWTNETAIGQQFYTPSGYEKIVGVIKDFHFVSLQQPVGPFVLDIPPFYYKAYWTRYLAVRLKPGDQRAAIAGIEKIWNDHTQEFPFEYFFLDDNLNTQYVAQEKLGKLVACFSVLAILIACIGLFALAAYSAAQRTKEIGIRKVMGATAFDIARLLSIDFLKPVIISVLIAWPLSWYMLSKWLQEFAFRMEMNLLLFVISGIAALLIAWITVMFQAMKAAFSNPTKSLRYE